MARMQSTEIFINNAVSTSKNEFREALHFIYKEDGMVCGSDGKVLHVEFNSPHYENGLNHSRYSKKQGLEIAGNYPNVYRIIERHNMHTHSFRFKVAELQRAAKVAKVFNDTIDLVLTGDELLVKAKNHKGDVETFVGIENHRKNNYWKTDKAVRLDANQLIDGLQGLKHNEIAHAEITPDGISYFFIPDERLVALICVKDNS